MSSKETLGFQAEVKQLLRLMVHSLYGNKEIFLRELVSNASDACDKARFEQVAQGLILEGDPNFRTDVRYDAAARSITVSDNGIGMSRQEVVEHIGTIARSGTREFLDRLTSDAASPQPGVQAQLIGQFGVGFYSSFIVADRVTLVTRRADATADAGVRWESAGEGEYSIETVQKDARGTEVTLHLRPGDDDLLSGSRLRTILHKYSDHLTFPIFMKKERWDSDKKAQVLTDEEEQVNKASALWTRPKADISEAEYEEFYKHVSHDFEAPLAWTHAKVEGRQEFTQLFFLPRQAPLDLWDRDRRHGVKLYVRRVFIMDSAEELLPAYLRFVRGIIDSSDLPLNVSREILQQSSDVAQIRNASTKRVIALLEDLAEKQPEKYRTFWTEFGRVIKEGVVEDPSNRDRLAKLLRFTSTKADGATPSASLADYVGRLKTGQDAIYYLTADGLPAAIGSPHLEAFRKHDVEVLLLTDRVDEWVVTHLTEFQGKPLKSAAQGSLDVSKLGAESVSAAQPAQREDFKDLLSRMQDVLKERASQVRLTDRLTDSPACLVADEHGMSRHLERLLREAGQMLPSSRPIFEVNPDHPIVQRLKRESDAALVGDWTHVLFDQALLAEGAALDDSAGFVKRLNALTLALAGEGKPRLWTPGG
ncbi:MAG: molecular chaperone HtpG [Acidimicrobiia bacterium]|nr:molecular chaperone HtpG [Acidimicrobiia bacterium]